MYGTLTLKQIDNVFDKKGLVLIVLYGHHGNQYYVAKSKEGFFNYFLELLKTRKDNGYFYQPEKPTISVSDEVFAALPEGSLRVFASQERKNYDKNLAEYKDDLYKWDLINKAIKESDGRLAYSVINDRSGYEYERMLVEEADILE